MLEAVNENNMSPQIAFTFSNWAHPQKKSKRRKQRVRNFMWRSRTNSNTTEGSCQFILKYDTFFINNEHSYKNKS